ncbi:MAG: helix-hairpin-helix domain-containing protein [Candidatus Anammoxibacter sp.]
MNISIKSLIKFSLLTFVLVFVCIFPAFADDIQTFFNVRLVNNPSNDGDSFHVDAAGRHIHVRLYFVDCPETSISSKSDARHVREQTRYFGLSSADRTIHFGSEAKKFVDGILSKPFTLYTAFASALGRSSKGRVYGFVVTADENDLASLLVKNGFARAYGIGRKTPGGIPRDEMVERLRDLEASAMLKRTGLWSESDPDRITELRAKQRSEDQELEKLVKPKSFEGTLDLNTATEEELQFIKGIGPVLAARIVDERPYKTVDDLLKVKGIGPKNLEKIRPYLVVGKEIGNDND